MRRFLIIALSFVSILPFVSGISAQALTVSPLKFTYHLEAGDQVGGTITLVNDSATEQTYTPTVQDFVASDETGTPRFLNPGTSTYSLISWVTFKTDSVTLKPGEKRNVAFTITVPEDAASGGYYGGLLFGNSSGGQNVAIAQKVGTLVLIAVGNGAKPQGNIVGFDTSTRLVSHLPVSFAARIENSGQIFTEPSGYITVSNIIGGKTTVIPFNPDQGSILPSSTRRFETAWQKNELPENTPEIVKEWQNFGFGRYTATLTVSFDGTTTQSASTTFWIIPWQLLIATGLVIALLLIVSRRRKQK